MGILPTDVIYRLTAGDGSERWLVHAQLVVITEGARWLHGCLSRALRKVFRLPDACLRLEYLGEQAGTLYGKGTAVTNRHYPKIIDEVTGNPPSNRRRRRYARTWRRKRCAGRLPVDSQQLLAEGYGIDRLLTHIITEP